MSKYSLFPEPRQGLPGYQCTVQEGLRATLLCIDSMRNESRKKKNQRLADREGPGVTSLFLGRQHRWWEIFHPCSGSGANLALGWLGSSSLLSPGLPV